MAGYAAVVSAMQTILRLESSRISFVAPCGEILDNVYVELYNLHGTLQRLDKSSPSKSRKKVNGLDGRIKEAVWEFEDLLESHLSDHILSQDIDVPLSSVDLRGQQHQFVSFIETLKGLHDEYLHELLNMPLVEDDELGSSGDDFDGIMVGLTNDFEDMKSRLTDENGDHNTFMLHGMAGVGKTNFARKLYEDTATLRSCMGHSGQKVSIQ